MVYWKCKGVHKRDACESTQSDIPGVNTFDKAGREPVASDLSQDHDPEKLTQIVFACKKNASCNEL